MFGSNFAEHFGIPSLDFPLQNADAQGGLLGPNAPGQALIGSQPLGPQVNPPTPSSPPAGAGAAPQPTPQGAQPSTASPFSSPLQPGQTPQQPMQQPGAAPAAGVNSQFGGMPT